MASFKSTNCNEQPATFTTNMIDEEEYRRMVLRSGPDLTEKELDQRLELEARVLDLQCWTPSLHPAFSSISAASFACNSEKAHSAISQSTAPTSCSSSDRRHTYQAPLTHPLQSTLIRSSTPSLYSFNEKKPFAFRNSFRRMSLFRKRRSEISNAASIPASIEPLLDNFAAVDRQSTKKSLESPTSITSTKSSWSMSMSSTANETHGEPPLDEKDTMEPTHKSVEVEGLQTQQREEGARFFEYQRRCIADLRLQHERAKKYKLEAQSAIIRESKIKVQNISPSSHLLFLPS